MINTQREQLLIICNFSLPLLKLLKHTIILHKNIAVAQQKKFEEVTISWQTTKKTAKCSTNMATDLQGLHVQALLMKEQIKGQKGS